MFNPLTVVDWLITWFTEKISRKARILLVVFFLLFVLAGGVAAYKVNDYFENDPDACIICHVHDSANQAWSVSEHKSVNCHDCHHSTKLDQVRQLYHFVFLGHKTITPRHGKIIVPRKFCMDCHWERNEKYPSAKLVSSSQYHMRHVVDHDVECTRCHGYVIHKFAADEKVCFRCHEGKEVHGKGMEQLQCFNCHTERRKDLRPDRAKCLVCHGQESTRQELLKGGTLDVRFFQVSEADIRKATKIEVPAGAPMQFDCYRCHKPHQQARADWNDCLKCHSDAPAKGKHEVHIKGMSMKCRDCHKPHGWTVTEEQARRECIRCHEYKDPQRFIGA
ncbi:MAG: cytochrome c3 family protein [Nitrospirota bacterium]